jgi:hypothetical protein
MVFFGLAAYIHWLKGGLSMKEAIRIDLDGFYIEPELVPLDTYGVTEIYETPTLSEPEEGEEPPEQPEPILVGYRVAVPAPQGLFKLRYDLDAWQAALTAYDDAMDAYRAALAAYDPDSEDGLPQLPAPVDLQAYWVEGLTQAEIDAIRNAPQPETGAEKIARLEVENALIGQQLVERELESLAAKEERDMIGAQLVQRELEVLSLQTDNALLGQQVVGLDLRLLTLEGSAGA